MTLALMQGEDVTLDLIIPRAKAGSRQEIFHILAGRMSLHLPYTQDDLERFLAMSDLKSAAGIGGGVYLPYTALQTLKKPFSVLMTLQSPLRIPCADGKPVDIVFALLLPAKDGKMNLARVSRITRLFRQQDLCAQLRAALSENEIYGAFLGQDPASAAA